ncbi:MAG TPA: glycosyltransferase family 4 protein [bacterium]|nr:glycosyltransferase family 4 protein [bacterium]
MPAFGGAAAVGENIIAQLGSKYDFYVYAISSHTQLKSGRHDGVEIIVFNAIRWKKLNIILYYLRSALHCIFRGKYSLIHLHHRETGFIVPFLKTRFPVVLTTHGTQPTEKHYSLRHLFRLQDRLFLNFPDIVVCPSLKDQLYVTRLRKRLTKHITNGVCISDEAKQSYSINNIICFAAGRIIPSKGCHLFLEAMQLIKYDGKLLVAGDLKQMPKYAKELSKHSKGLNVVWLGLIKDKEKLFNTICQSDIFVFPSAIESMSMMLLEAASLGVPIIASDIKENKDIFTTDEVLFFRTGDARDLADKYSWAITHYNNMIAMAKAAQEKLRTQYAWPKLAVQYDKVYDYLLKSNH